MQLRPRLITQCLMLKENYRCLLRAEIVKAFTVQDTMLFDLTKGGLRVFVQKQLHYNDTNIKGRLKQNLK